jgi:hypothetical protein
MSFRNILRKVLLLHATNQTRVEVTIGDDEEKNDSKYLEKA